MNDEVLSAESLAKSYRTAGGSVHSVRDVSLKLKRGKTLAIIGESGCGKSTLARMLVGLEQPDRGKVSRATLIPMVFQDSLGSLHPRRTAKRLIVDPVLIRDGKIRMTRDHDVLSIRLAKAVGLSEEHLEHFPHELSGGQRQRVNIARALALDPAVILLDEPVSALDVSIQAQILNLLVELQEARGLSIIFISHDLSVVRHLAHDVQVLYLGSVVEEGTVAEVLTAPQHPYTRSLISSELSVVDFDKHISRVQIRGEPPSPFKIQSGCSYVDRCDQAEVQCKSAVPKLQGEPSRRVACFPEHRKQSQRAGVRA